MTMYTVTVKTEMGTVSRGELRYGFTSDCYKALTLTPSARVKKEVLLTEMFPMEPWGCKILVGNNQAGKCFFAARCVCEDIVWL